MTEEKTQTETATSGELPRPGVSSTDPELPGRAVRRKFTAQYKLGILTQVEALTKPGEIGALLRREGLYTSHLTHWRKQRDAGALQALGRSRGRPKGPGPSQAATVIKLRLRAERAEAQLERARRVIEVQGKVSALLGDLLETKGADPSTGR